MLSSFPEYFGKNDKALIDKRRDRLVDEKRKRIEIEIAKAAVNNFSKTTAKLLKKYKDVDFSLEFALAMIRERVENQLASANEFDDYSNVLWALTKTKKYSQVGRSNAAAVAIVTGKFFLLH